MAPTSSEAQINTCEEGAHDLVNENGQDKIALSVFMIVFSIAFPEKAFLLTCKGEVLDGREITLELIPAFSFIAKRGAIIFEV